MKVTNKQKLDIKRRLQYINIKPLDHANKRRWKNLVIGLFWLFSFLLTVYVLHWCAQHRQVVDYLRCQHADKILENLL